MLRMSTADEDEELEAQVTHGRTYQIRHHVSRRSIQIKRSASLTHEDPNNLVNYPLTAPMRSPFAVPAFG